MSCSCFQHSETQLVRSTVVYTSTLPRFHVSGSTGHPDSKPGNESLAAVSGSLTYISDRQAAGSP